MKTIVVTFFAVLTVVGLQAQPCTPDTTIQANGGIFPDSATGIPPAFVNEPYQQTVTIVAPTDTMVSVIPGTPAQTVLVDSIVLDSVFTLPSWLTYACDPPTCAFAGGTYGCITFSGTPPVGEGNKSYQVNFITRSHGRLLLLPNTPLPAQYDTTFAYYTLVVNEEPLSVAASSNHEWRIYPNPATHSFQVTGLDATQPALLRAWDVTGRMVHQEKVMPNSIVETSDWHSGMYWVHLKQGDIQSTHAILIQKSH